MSAALRAKIGRWIDPASYFAFDYTSTDRILQKCTPLPDPALRSQITQLIFLLNSAPIMDAPAQRDRVLASRAPFAYIHPITFAGILFFMRYTTGPELSVTVFPGSPTKWVVTSLMPKGRVIYSPLQIPGIEKILAR